MSAPEPRESNPARDDISINHRARGLTKNGYPHFAMIPKALYQTDLKAGERDLYALLLSFRHPDTHLASATIKQLCEFTNASTHAVRRRLAKLEENRLIEIHRGYYGRSRAQERVNAYRVHTLVEREEVLAADRAAVDNPAFSGTETNPLSSFSEDETSPLMGRNVPTNGVLVGTKRPPLSEGEGRGDQRLEQRESDKSQIGNGETESCTTDHRPQLASLSASLRRFRESIRE